MAVLAAQDWHLPSSSQAMDSPTTANQSPSRQQHTPSPNSVNHPSTMAQQSNQQLPLHLQQQPYPYPVQQQQASWSPTNTPYYPGFYQNTPPHSPYMHQGHQTQMSPNPFYDANNQFAQWAYQQMMFNAQQNHQIPMYSQHPATSGSQRSRSGSNGAQQEFYPAGNVFNPFPSGTPPPPHPSPGNNGYPRSATSDPNQPYGGFHPYRRPNRQQSQDAAPPQQHDWRSNTGGPPVFQPPYARNDASASSTSVNSSSSQSSRRRKDSQGSTVGGQNGTNPPQPSRSTPARTSNNTSGSPSSTNQRPHNRHPSASSTTSSVVARPNGTSSSASATPNNSNTPSPSNATPRPVKPSPLSQGNFTVAEKRVSRDDSDLGKVHDSTPGGSRGGLKSRFRRALSFNALQEEEVETPSKGKTPETRGETPVKSEAIDSPDPASSTLPKKSRKPLFNSKLNASTDNISLSSTMSSASMVIRKLGNISKLTRRNSLAGITSLFKDKKDKEGEEGKSKRKVKKGAKAEASEASVSLATAELDRSEWSAELNGLTPAARLARQHTLKSNAEAAERAKAEAQKNTVATPPAWEKNSSNRQGDLANGPVSEDGIRPADEDSDSDDDNKFAGPSNNHISQDSLDGWDDNEDWGEGEDDEDITIRGGVDSIDLNEDMEPWAIGLRRSVEKTRVPAKGILKLSTSVVEPPGPAFTVRARSNSYNSAPTHTTEIGPLARISSSDPDHIDGLHHPHPQQPPPSSSITPALPPLSFMSGSAIDSTDSNPSPQAEKMFFSHSNSSAPVLSAVFSSNPPSLAHRSATAPVKRLTFASNLSVYDTFPSSVYDRRSEPATWSRLTPVLAQRIKEELNSYKMEEMEVHAASRIHTQFFV